MSQNIEENRKKFPREFDNFKVGSKDVDTKKVWEPKSDYDSKYTKNHVTTYRSGHSVEFDDTEGAERIRITHASGSYTEWQHDGKVIHRSQDSSYEVVLADKNVRVKGGVQIDVDGDANINVKGNSDVAVGGNANLTVGAQWTCKADVIKFITPLFTVEGTRMEHNGINVGWDHVHRDVMPGAGTSGPPLP